MTQRIRKQRTHAEVADNLISLWVIFEAGKEDARTCRSFNGRKHRNLFDNLAYCKGFHEGLEIRKTEATEGIDVVGY